MTAPNCEVSQGPNVISLHDLPAAVGRDLGVTAWHRIPQSDVNVFGALTRDEQWIHIDEERARQGPFGHTVVHGFLTLALMPFFLDQLLVVEGISMGVNYGLEKVRFPSSVPAGSQVRGHANIVRVEPEDGRTRVTVRLTLTSDANERPACVADLVAVFFP